MMQGQHVISPDVQDLHLLEHVTLVAMCASSSPLIHCSENDGCGCSWIIACFIVDQVLDYMTVFFCFISPLYNLQIAQCWMWSLRQPKVYTY